MLQNKLTHIKGQLLEMMFEMYRDMNTDKDGTDYEEFYNEIQSSLNEIKSIHNLNDLERFCESYGLNDDITTPMSFPALVLEVYKD